MATKKALLTMISEPVPNAGHKITVVGAGRVGVAVALSILKQGVTKDLVLVDNNLDKAKGEMMDLLHGTSFLKNARVKGDSDFSYTADSKVCVITAGFAQAKGESRLNLVQRNANVLKSVIPQLVKYSPDTILLMATNPVDVMTYIAWKLSGLHHSKVIGSGTTVDTSRLRYLVGEKLGVPATSIHGWVIGEHGDSSVAVWSTLNVAGVRLRELNPAIGTDKDPENWKDLHKKVISAAYDVIQLKGYTCWAVGLSICDLVDGILKNSNDIKPVSTHVKSLHGINDEVYLSLPAQIGFNGVTSVVQLQLTESEATALRSSADVMIKTQQLVKL